MCDQERLEDVLRNQGESCERCVRLGLMCSIALAACKLSEVTVSACCPAVASTNACDNRRESRKYQHAVRRNARRRPSLAQSHLSSSWFLVPSMHSCRPSANKTCHNLTTGTCKHLRQEARILAWTAGTKHGVQMLCNRGSFRPA
jgi:hypothetical protein